MKAIIIKVILAAVAAFIFVCFWLNGSGFLMKNDTAQCKEKAITFLTHMNNNVNRQLDYSFAENDSALTNLLGNEYNFVASKDSNCYALVKNYNPIISEYRYSILNVDTDVLEAVLLDHDLGEDAFAKAYQKQFVVRYGSLFR